MDWTTDAFLEQLYVAAAEKRGLSREHRSLQEHQGWLRGRLKHALGKLPDQEHPLDAVVLGQEDYGDFLLERVAYSTMEAVHVPVLVLVPKEGTGPWPPGWTNV
ncbi:hypothetical protein D3C76_143250 [compost metagenome]